MENSFKTHTQNLVYDSVELETTGKTAYLINHTWRTKLCEGIKLGFYYISYTIKFKSDF